MSLVRVKAGSTSASELSEVLVSDGAVIVEELLSAHERSGVVDALKPLLDAKAHGHDKFEGMKTKRLGSLVSRCPAVHPLILNELILSTVHEVMPDATATQLNATQVVALSPGEEPQSLHRDQWAWDHFPWPIGYDVELSTMWALTDFTQANGATRVAVGSNRTEGRQKIDESELEVADMPAGSVLLYTGSVIHGAGANTTDKTRLGMILSYTRGWLRQHENQYLCVPVEEAKGLPEQLQRLIGYERGAYAIGYWGDMDDPIEAVRPGAGTSGLGGALAVPK